MGERMNGFASTVVFVFAFVKNGDGVAFCAMFQFWLGWLVGVGWWKGKGEEGEEEELFFFFFK